MNAVAEVIVDTSVPILPADRVAHLRALGTDELLALVRTEGTTLSGDELLLIHDIAAERATQGNGAASGDWRELGRATLLVALKRSA